MHPFSTRVVRRVLQAGGSFPLPDAFADLAELERLALAISKRQEPRFDEIEAPIYVGDVAFYPPTLGVIAWARRVSGWFKDEPEIGELALLFGLTVAKQGEYRDLLDAASARKAIHRWALRNRISAVHAREVLGLLFPKLRETDHMVRMKALRMEHGDEAARWSEKAMREVVSAWLDMNVKADQAEQEEGLYKSVIYSCMREYGGDEDHWIFDVSLDRLLAAADEILKHNEAEAEAESKARGAGGASRWSVEAQVRFNVFARALERKYLPPPDGSSEPVVRQ